MSNFAKKKKLDVKIPRCCGHKMKFGLMDLSEKPTKKSLYENYQKKMRGEETSKESTTLDDMYAYSCPYCGKSILAKENGEMLSQEESENLFKNNNGSNNQLPEGVTEEMIREAIAKEHPEFNEPPKQLKVILDIDIPTDKWTDIETLTIDNVEVEASKAIVYEANIPLDEFMPEIIFKEDSAKNENLLPYAWTEENKVYITAKDKLQEQLCIESLVFWTPEEYKRIESGEHRIDILQEAHDKQNNI